MQRRSTGFLTAVGIACVLLSLAGCGSGSGTTQGRSGTGGTSTGKYAIEQEIGSRGIKGESPATEAETASHISSGDCAALGARAGMRLGVHLDRRSDPSAPLSKCRLSAPGVTINAFLDTAFAAHQRYANRMEETQQFGAPDPDKIPHPVARVGEKGAYSENASWVPDYSTLFAVRGNRYLTIAYAARGRDNSQARAEAADLALLAFHLTAR